jgi:hypothetical protein
LIASSRIVAETSPAAALLAAFATPGVSSSGCARACFKNAFQVGRRIPQGLKPVFLLAHGGTAEEAAEKVIRIAKSSPQALKREYIFNDLRHE